MNASSAAVLAVIALLFAAVAVKIVRDRRAGKSSCGCGCASCGGACKGR
ncbi:MAG: FeoB-associated Cys-rich membrane protein [Kiritimatiellae bacterium]|nr:FeoB-associated Cys-rich membrane protein [Kiritimatiellia bacterium]